QEHLFELYDHQRLYELTEHEQLQFATELPGPAGVWSAGLYRQHQRQPGAFLRGAEYYDPGTILSPAGCGYAVRQSIPGEGRVCQIAAVEFEPGGFPAERTAFYGVHDRGGFPEERGKITLCDQDAG